MVSTICGAAVGGGGAGVAVGHPRIGGGVKPLPTVPGSSIQRTAHVRE
jgi:hypothetical protein